MAPVARTLSARLAAPLARMETNITIVSAHNLLCRSTAEWITIAEGSFADAINWAISGVSGTCSTSRRSRSGANYFAPTDVRQIHLLHYMMKRFDHVGVERVCSGIGPTCTLFIGTLRAEPLCSCAEHR